MTSRFLLTLLWAISSVAAQAGARFGDWIDVRPQVGHWIDLVDIDGDGLPDLAPLQGVTPVVFAAYFNLGDGDVTPLVRVRPRNPGFYFSGRLGWGDIDGDGDVDAVVSGWDRYPNEVVENLGQRRFRLAPLGSIPADPAARTVAFSMLDADNDGDLDALAWREGMPSLLFLNNGAGKFVDGTAGRLPTTPAQDFYEAEIADLNGDGLSDVVIAEKTRTRVWLNRGGRTLAEAHTWSGSAGGVRIADFDGQDGPDVLVLGQSIDLYMQRPGGVFQVENWRIPSRVLNPGTLPTDLDGDGDIDLFVGGIWGVMWNDGTGKFAIKPLDYLYPLKATNLVTHSVRADFDGDGDLDLVRFGIARDLMHTWWNLERHAYCPRATPLGGQIKVELFGPAGEVFVPHVGQIERQQRIPGLGIWFLQSPFATLPALRIPANQDTLTYSIPVPNNPWLRGQKLIFQHAAVDLSGASPKVRIMQRNPVSFY